MASLRITAQVVGIQLSTMSTESTSTHSLERELLLACAGRLPREGASPALRQFFSADIDWGYLTHAAEHHRLVPLLYGQLSQTAAMSVPEHILNHLRQAYVLNAAHNLRLTAELLRLIDLFQSNGIAIVPFKGPVLAELLYGNVSLRQFGDLDILVKREDVRRAREILVADGYQPEFVLSGKFEAEYIRSEHAFQFQKENCTFVVELHWRFGSRNQVFPLDARDVWNRLARQFFQGRELPALAREDLLIYLCVHGAKHGWDRLEWIRCVAELVSGSDAMNWDIVIRRSRQSGAERALYVGLRLAESLASPPLPAPILDAMRSDGAAQVLAEQALANLFTEETDHSRRELHRQTFYLRTRERWFDRARILFFSTARVPHPLAKDWHLFKVPVSMSFLYYLLRPMRLMREYGFRRLRAMLRPNTTF